MEKLFPFILHHWLLVAGFMMALLALIIVEWRSKGTRHGLSALQLTQLVNHEGALIVDIRDANVFAEGHIVKAMNIPFVNLEQHLKRLEKNKEHPIIIVGTLGQQSAVAMRKLHQQGFGKVHQLTGGMTAWKNANMPVVKG